MRRFVLLSSLFLAAATAVADDASWREPVREEFKAYQAILYDPPKAPRGSGSSPEYRAMVREWSQRLMAQKDVFLGRFGETPWEQWTSEDDPELVEVGLSVTGQRAYERGDGETAVRAYELMLTKLPEVRRKLVFPVRRLPLAYVLAGDAERAESRTVELLEDAAAMYRPRLQVLLGDLACLRGDVDAAKGHYAQVVAEVTDDLRRCCGGEADAWRDAEVKLRALQRNWQWPDPEWMEGELNLRVRGPHVTVAACADLFRSWDVAFTAKLLRDVPRIDRRHVEAVVLTQSDKSDATPEWISVRKPRYDQRSVIPLGPRERAAEVRATMSLDVPVIGLAPDALPATLWTGDYDVVLSGRRGPILYVRGPAQDRTMLRAVVESFLREKQ